MLKKVLLIMLIGFCQSIFALTLSSPALENNKSFLPEFTCDGSNISLPLTWNDVPLNTKSFALIMRDPDASNGDWVHWIIFNIPATTTSLKANLKELPVGAAYGKNNWGKEIYKGPCPPNKRHRYFITLYALDNLLTLTSPNIKELEAAMKDHVLASAKLMGYYSRAR